MSFQCATELPMSEWVVSCYTDATFVVTYSRNGEEGEELKQYTLIPQGRGGINGFYLCIESGVCDFDYITSRYPQSTQKITVQSEDGTVLKTWVWPASETEDDSFFTKEGLWRKHFGRNRDWVFELTEEVLGLNQNDPGE